MKLSSTDAMAAAELLRIIALCLIPSLFCFLRLAALAPSHAIPSPPAAALDGHGVIASSNRQRRAEVDAVLADFALRRLRQEGRDVKTGIAYDVALPSWTAPLQGAVKRCDVMKGKAGSIGRRGLQLNGFNLPRGIRPALLSNSTAASSPPQAADEDFPMNQLVLVYRRIEDSRGLDFTFYSLPHGYIFMSPVVGIISYTFHADDPLLNTSSLAEVQLMTSSTASITIAVPDVGSASHSSSIAAAAAASATTIHGSTELLLLCVFFSPDGSFSFSNLTQPPNICSSPILVDVAIVAAAGSDSAPMAPPPGDGSGASGRNHGSGSTANSILSPAPKPSPRAPQQNHPHRSFIVVILALGGGLLLFVATIVAICLLVHAFFKGELLGLCRGPDEDEAKDEVKEMFETTRSVGHIRAPTVPSLRTQPSLEVGSLRFPCETL